MEPDWFLEVRSNEQLQEKLINLWASPLAGPPWPLMGVPLGRKRKWCDLGANAIVTKPDLPNLVQLADSLLQ